MNKQLLQSELIRHAKLLAGLNIPIIIYSEPNSGEDALARHIHHERFKGNDEALLSFETPYGLLRTSANLRPLANLKSLVKSGARPEEQHSCVSKDRSASNIPTIGTLFIKNIDETSPADQQSLLAFLATKSPSLHLIVTSRPTLFKQMQDTLFNKDLFYHLTMAPIEIPVAHK